jgi:hypothetical protein
MKPLLLVGEPVEAMVVELAEALAGERVVEPSIWIVKTIDFQKRERVCALTGGGAGLILDGSSSR